MSRTQALLILALLLACVMNARSVLAQGQTRSQTPAPATQPGVTEQNRAAQNPANPNDLEITANVTARELRFEVVPETKVEFTGHPERDTVWEAERQNLPRPVQPGVTYRNIGIQLKITSRFADIDRIVAEALGEAPVTDDAPPQTVAPQPNRSSAPASPSPTQGRKP